MDRKLKKLAGVLLLAFGVVLLLLSILLAFAIDMGIAGVLLVLSVVLNTIGITVLRGLR